MAKPGILLVIEGTYPWYRGGVSEWVHRYITHFKDFNFDILQVATDQYLNSGLDEALYRMPGHVRSFKRVPPPDLSASWAAVSSGWFKKVLNESEQLSFKPDLVHVANTGVAGWLGMSIARLGDLPLILTEHALYWKEVQLGAAALECGYKIPRQEFEKVEMSDMFRLLASRIYARADRVISVSRCNIPEQKKLGAKNPEYISNGVDASWLDASKRKSSGFTVGWIGRCAEMKNPLRFFDVIDALRAETNDISFIMMSCDANEPELWQKLKDKLRRYPEVTFLWNKPAEEAIHAMDALCVTSHNESQPLVIFEALAKKVLPFGWRVGDVSEEFALVVEPGASAAELAQRVLSYWQSSEWEQLMTQLHQKVRKNHTWEAVFKQYRNIFNPYLATSEIT